MVDIRDRARALLRSGADVHSKPGPTVPSPLEREQSLAPSSAAASLVVRAAGPWSANMHDLFGEAERRQAAMAAQSLYHLYLRKWAMAGC